MAGANPASGTPRIDGTGSGVEMTTVRPFLFSVFMALIALIAFAPLDHAAGQVPVAVSQKFRNFHPDHITIKAGQTLDISNNDIFVHELYIQSPQFDFESGEQPPGKTVAITFDHPGTYHVRCHIHPMMDLTVVVRPTDH
jgi:plastocyanin